MERFDWFGEEKKTVRFQWNGRDAVIVFPDQPKAHKPWIWRTEFFGLFAQVDKYMCDHGWFVVWVDIHEEYGCPESIEIMHEFQKYATAEFGLSEKCVPFGFSRGALCATEYALKYPESVSKLYLDAPLLDFAFFPGPRGVNPMEPARWAHCLSRYGMTEEEAFRHTMPAARGAELSPIPMVIVTGDEDKSVPMEKFTNRFMRDYMAAGGDLLLIVKPGGGHHPHSTHHPECIYAFLDDENKEKKE